MTGALHRARPAGLPRGRMRPDFIYLGWQLARGQPDPGPMPVAPGALVLDEISADWLTAQRAVHARLTRPARLGSAVGLGWVGLGAGCWLAGLLGTGAALLLTTVGGAGAVGCLRQLVRAERALRAQLRAEGDRVSEFRATQQAEFSARQEQHAQAVREWQQRSAAYRRQPRWHPVVLPIGVSRLDLAGGTRASWSASLTTIASGRLAAGGEVTVVDLTEGGIAGDLLALAARLRIDPVVCVLPADLARFDLGLRLRADARAEVLALTVAAADAAGAGPFAGPGAGPGAAGDPATDAALLSRVLEVLGPGASLAQLTAGLRVLAQIGAPETHLSGELISPVQVSGLWAAFGSGADRIVIDRAWALEARLRVLDPLGSAGLALPPSRLRVVWPDRRAAPTGNRVLGCYLTVALTEVLRSARPARPWQQCVCLLGAERLPGDVLDRLCDAAEAAGTGLVIGYRSIPPQVRERLGRGNAAVAFMRAGNAEDAKAAAEQIGTEHRFVLSQFTDTVGASLTDTFSDSYTSTVGSNDSVADSLSASWSAGQSRGRGRSRQGASGGFTPFAAQTGSASQDASRSVSVSDSRSVTEGISAGTSWGTSTARALGMSDSLASTMQRSREFVVEQHELQHLPHTAAVVCQRGPGGRQVVLADTNPAIMTLPTASFGLPPASG